MGQTAPPDHPEDSRYSESMESERITSFPTEATTAIKQASVHRERRDVTATLPVASTRGESSLGTGLARESRLTFPSVILSLVLKES